MQDISIRRMAYEDIAACAEIVVATPLWQRYGVPKQSAPELFEIGLHNQAILYVADAGSGKILGFVWVVMRGAFDLSGYIRWIGVTEQYQGGGIGRQLLAAAENYVRQTAHDVFLLCSDFNVDAQRFYLRQGYIHVGSLPDYVLPGVAELIFRKRL